MLDLHISRTAFPSQAKQAKPSPGEATVEPLRTGCLHGRAPANSKSAELSLLCVAPQRASCLAVAGMSGTLTKGTAHRLYLEVHMHQGKHELGSLMSAWRGFQGACSKQSALGPQCQGCRF